MSEWQINYINIRNERFSPGDKIKVFSTEKIDEIVDEDGRTYTVDKWAGHVLTVQHQIGNCVSVEETDITFADFIVEKFNYQLPEHLFKIE